MTLTPHITIVIPSNDALSCQILWHTLAGLISGSAYDLKLPSIAPGIPTGALVQSRKPGRGYEQPVTSRTLFQDD